MDTKLPKVSVIMPVYNGDKYIKEAIDSILAQTFTDFELIIINDGSTDQSVRIIESYTDARIKLVQNDKNMGLSITRNKGLRLAQGEYIANLDCDDVTYPTRLEKQVDFLDRNTDYGLIGSYIETVDKNGQIIENSTWSFPASAQEIPTILFFANYFAQSATMIRKSALPTTLYREDLPPAEDYDLWIRIAEKSKVWNLQEVLTQIRNHGENTSIINKKDYLIAMPLIYDYQLSKLKFTYSGDELRKHYLYCIGKYDATIENVQWLKAWFEKLHTANNASRVYNQTIFIQALLGRWYLLCKQTDTYWWLPSKIFWRSSLCFLTGLTIKNKVLFACRIIVHRLKK